MDTFCIRLNENTFKIEKPKIFDPSADSVYSRIFPMGRRPYIRATYNPTTTDMKNVGYLPRLTLQKMPIKKDWKIFLDIEFSAPKILFGNNFEELTDNDFNDLCKELCRRLELVGVVTTIDAVKKAGLRKVHYSKNIIFEDGTIPSMAITELSKCDLSLRLDKNDKEYRNDGYSVKWHSNSVEFIAYDKKADLQKSKISDKRAIEKDNSVQLGLFETMQKIKPYEVLRFEIRLNDEDAIKRTFASMTVNVAELNFENVFKTGISQWILMKYWEELKRSYRLFNYGSEDFAKFMAEIKINNPKIKMQKAIMLYQVTSLVKTMGIRQLRTILANYYSVRSWYALKKQFKDINLAVRLPDSFEKIDRTISEFEPVKNPRTTLQEQIIKKKKVLDIEEFMQ